MSLIKSIGSKKVNLDFNKNFITIFSEKINISDLQFINQTLKDLHPSDVANLIENLSDHTRIKLIEIESFNIAQELFIELN
jgi:Mg/Co/Ni transporter MgtE